MSLRHRGVWLLPSAFNHSESEASQVQKKKRKKKRWGHITVSAFLRQNLTSWIRDRCCCCWLLWWETFNKRTMNLRHFPQILDQDLWVVGDRSREEGVPSRFGRGTGMCPLIRLGNCRGRERDRVSGEGMESLWKPLSGKELLHCHCSGFLFCFLFFLIHCAASFLSLSPPTLQQKSSYLRTMNPV